jgi:hypothetical protein
MTQIPKPKYRTAAEIRARIMELEKQERRLRRSSERPRHHRAAQMQMGSLAEPLFKPNCLKTLH